MSATPVPALISHLQIPDLLRQLEVLNSEATVIIIVRHFRVPAGWQYDYPASFTNCIYYDIAQLWKLKRHKHCTTICQKLVLITSESKFLQKSKKKIKGSSRHQNLQNWRIHSIFLCFKNLIVLRHFPEKIKRSRQENLVEGFVSRLSGTAFICNF